MKSPTRFLVCNKEQYQAFLETYPNELIKTIIPKTPYQPLMIIHYDVTLGDYPGSIVARSCMERHQQINWDIRDMVSIR